MNLCTSCSLTNRKTLSEFSWTSTRPVVNAVRRSPNPMGTVDPLSVSIRGVLIGPSARILSPAKSAGERSGLFELKCLKPPDSHHPRTRIPVLVRRSSASFFPKAVSRALHAFCINAQTARLLGIEVATARRRGDRVKRRAFITLLGGLAVCASPFAPEDAPQMLSTINSTNPTPTNQHRKRHGIVFEPMPIIVKHLAHSYSNAFGNRL